MAGMPSPYRNILIYGEGNDNGMGLVTAHRPTPQFLDSVIQKGGLGIDSALTSKQIQNTYANWH